MQAFIKPYGVPILIILLAATVVCIAALPLAGTQWAEGFRLSIDVSADDNDAVGAVVTIIGPLIKVTILMGIGVLLTTAGRQLARFKR